MITPNSCTAIAMPTLIQQTLREWKMLASLGSPILITQLAQMANGVIDTVMAGRYGARDLAGVAIGNSFWMPILLFFIGILTALQPTISTHRGAQTLHKITPVTWQGIYIALCSAAIMMALLFSVEPALGWLKLDAATAEITQGYLHGFLWGVPAMLLIVALRGFTDGLGHTRVIMSVSLLSTLINMPLNYIFIYGKFGIPAMGGVGCGWATALANIMAFIVLLIYLHRSKTFQQLSPLKKFHRPDFHEIKKLLRLGIPIGSTLFFEVSMFTVIALFLAPLGPIVVAGHQLVLNFVSLMFMVPLSLGMALTLRVSFLVGQGKVETAHQLARSTLLLALSIAMVYVPLLTLGTQFIASAYTKDAEVIAVAVQLLKLAAIFQVADVLQVAAISGLRGFHDTRVPMLIILLSFWGIAMPLGYTLTFTNLLLPAMGAAGFWLALIAGLVSACILLVLRLFRFKPRVQSSH